MDHWLILPVQYRYSNCHNQTSVSMAGRVWTYLRYRYRTYAVLLLKSSTSCKIQYCTYHEVAPYTTVPARTFCTLNVYGTDPTVQYKPQRSQVGNHEAVSLHLHFIIIILEHQPSPPPTTNIQYDRVVSLERRAGEGPPNARRSS